MSLIKKIILGTVQFGLPYGINNKLGQPSENKVFEILDLAYRNGINTLDTAEAYGSSHDVIKKYLDTSENNFDVITKYSSIVKIYPKDLIQRIIFHHSFFKKGALRGYMFHSFEDFKGTISEQPLILKRIRQETNIEKIGVSIYSNKELDYVLDHDIDFIQLPFNLLDNENKRSKSLIKAKDKGVEVHVRSCFLQGLFFKTPSLLSGNLVVLKPYLEKLNNVAKENKIDMSTLALQYVLRKPYIDKVVIGVDSVKQLKNNVESIQTVIDNDDIFRTIDLIDVEEIHLLNPSQWKV